MDVILTKASSTAITYGSEETLEVVRLTNVTNIAFVESALSYYAITHQTGSDATPHTTNYGVNEYIISIIPNIK